MATGGHAAPSRNHPQSTLDLSADRVLNLGEYSQEKTLSHSEARIVLERTLEARAQRSQPPVLTSTGQGDIYVMLNNGTETLRNTFDYLQIFSAFKDLDDAKQVEQIIDEFGAGLENFERSQIGSLVPSCADEAKSLVPSLEKKIEDGLVEEDALERLCQELGRVKRSAQLNST